VSLDISLTVGACEHCGRGGDEMWEGNITYNLSEMWRAAGLPYSEDIEGKPAREMLPRLETGLAALRAEPARFEAMNPPNKWGSYAGLLDFTTRLIDAAREYPEAIVTASR
jgi:hypothetical protein